MLRVKDQLAFTPTENDIGIWRHMCTHVPAYARREIYGLLPSCREAISSAVNLKLWFPALLFLCLSMLLCTGRKLLEGLSRLLVAGTHLRPLSLLLGLILSNRRRQFPCRVWAAGGSSCGAAPRGGDQQLQEEAACHWCHHGKCCQVRCRGLQGWY